LDYTNTDINLPFIKYVKSKGEDLKINFKVIKNKAKLSFADITIDIAFWTYLVFTLLLAKCISIADRQWLSFYLFPPVEIKGVKAGDSHLDGNYLLCRLCHQINTFVKNADINHPSCQRCYARLHLYNPEKSTQYTTAILLASIIFYFPANFYPMIYTISIGASQASTIMDGVILLWQMGSYPVALVILTASIILPMSKMLIMLYLLWSQRQESSLNCTALEKLRLYRFIELIGRWSMIDVFVVAMLAALIQFGELMRITPGAAVVYFTLVVVLTLLSAAFFDPRMFWKRGENIRVSSAQKETV
ncbi:MAG: paraquat-inducible protein A, partial [Endozoicomonas sp.]